MNGTSSPEVEELVSAFKKMTNIVQKANRSLARGDVEIAQQSLCDAKLLFTKLTNDRGVRIVDNNLGSVYTTQARELAAQAAREAPRDPAKGRRLLRDAGTRFAEAERSFRLAVEDAENQIADQAQLRGEEEDKEDDGGGGADDSRQEEKKQVDVEDGWMGAGGGEGVAAAADLGGEFKEGGLGRLPGRTDIEVGAAGSVSRGYSSRTVSRTMSRTTSRAFSSHSLPRRGGGDRSYRPGSPSALLLQLANRKHNLALCLAEKGSSAVPVGGSPDLNAINEARRLLEDCAKLAAEREDAWGDQRHVECLIDLARLEEGIPGRHDQAGEALDRAQRVVNGYHGSGGDGDCGGGGGGGGFGESGGILPPPPPLAALRQQVLSARGTHCVAGGNPAEAVEHWTDAVIGCGDRMDVRAVRSSLEGLRGEAERGTPFPPALVRVLGSPGPRGLVAAVDKALRRLDAEASKHENAEGPTAAPATRVDLCFVMDCTRSVSGGLRCCCWDRIMLG